MTDTTVTRGQEVLNDTVALLRARNNVIWITTREEKRVELGLIEVAAAAKYVPYTWDCAAGAGDMTGKPVQDGGTDAGQMLDAIRALATADRYMAAGKADRRLWIMRDLPPWLQGPIGITPLRQLRNLARLLPGVETPKAQAIVILSPSADLPPELSGLVPVLEWPLPDRIEMTAVLNATLNALRPGRGPEEETDAEYENRCASVIESYAPNGVKDAAVDAAMGLTFDEAQSCFSASLVKLRKIDPPTIAKEKKRIIGRTKMLEWSDPLASGLDGVGGLENLKDWLQERASAFTPAARAYGLPAPKACLLVGVPGCGKTLFAKATSTAWEAPLIKLDLGGAKSKYVGESEANLRSGLKTLDAVGRSVVLVDEIEKSLAGAVQGGADGGVSSDALGTLLTWMQDRQGESFLVATANDISKLPPEFLRKGRFDEVWFVDLPNAAERVAVLKAALREFKRGTVEIDHAAVAKVCDGFTGSEIASLVPSAMFAAFNDRADKAAAPREITTTDLLNAAAAVKPLSKTAPEKITVLREWAAKGGVRLASKPGASIETVAAGGRLLEMDA